MNASPKKLNTSSSRLINFFKRFISRKQQIEIQKSLYQRDYDRFPVEFEVHVTLTESNGEVLHDRAELHDISGSGALFVTRIPEKYYPQQTLQLKIYLTGTDEVRACIKSESTVVRIQRINGDTSDGDSPLMGVAVKFNNAFEFERVGKNVFGDNK